MDFSNISILNDEIQKLIDQNSQNTLETEFTIDSIDSKILTPNNNNKFNSYNIKFQSSNKNEPMFNV